MQDTVPTGRFEWERIVRRIRMTKPLKLAALVLATYADPDGSRVRPGIEVLAAVTGDSEKNARRILSMLREMQLVEQVARGGGRGGRGKASEFRLTVPTDLLERFELLGPGDRPESPDTQMSAETGAKPVDNSGDASETPDTQMSGETGDAEPNDRTSRAPSASNDRTFSANDRTSRCPTTTHLTNHLQTNLVVTTRGEYPPRARDRPQRSTSPPADPTRRRAAA